MEEWKATQQRLKPPRTCLLNGGSSRRAPLGVPGKGGNNCRDDSRGRCNPGGEQNVGVNRQHNQPDVNLAEESVGRACR
jgi:hypothetical protein